MPAQDDNWQFVNVTQKTGQQIAGALTSWQTQDGPFIAEHVAGIAPNGDLLVFYFEPRFDWQFVNVTQKTGQQIAGALTSWQTQDGPFIAEHVAGIAPNGDLLVFYFEPRFDWQFVNVTQKTGQQIAGALTSWLTPGDPFTIEHVAARAPNGDLLVFWLSIWAAVGPYEDHNLTFDGHPVVLGAGRIDGIDISLDYDGAGHPAMYLAMPGGGVWRSSDFLSAAPTWSPLTDHLLGIPDTRRVELNNVSTLAVDPKHPQTIYARAGGSPPAILKTTDGGASWALIGEGQFGGAGGIARVLVDPLGTVYIAFDAGGFWQSIDGGATWTNVASAALAGVEFHDAVYFIDGGGQINIYVGVVDRQGQNRSGLWSFIGGNWTQMPIVMTNMRGQTFSPAVINHITMSVDPTAGACASLSRPDDGTNQVGLLNVFTLVQGTWQPQWFSNTVWFATQGGYVQGVCIAPDGRLYAGGIGLGQSAGGQSFVPIGTDSLGKSIHTDEHVVVAYQGQIYVGTDGGLTRFTPQPGQSGVVTWESLNTPSLTNFLSTGASAHPTDSGIFLVGNQDQGIARRAPNGQWSYSGFSNEREKLRFDPDPANQGRFAFSGDPNNGFYMSQDGGISFQGFGPPGVPAPDPPPPFSFHPNNSARIMIGWTTVYETPDRGITWNQKLTLQTPPSALTYVGDHSAYIGAGGQLYETHDDGQSWPVVNFDFGSSIVSLCADSANPDAIYVATPSRVLRRLNPQAAWEDLSGNLALAITVMALLPDQAGTDAFLFVGTGAGVFFAPILNGGNTVWARFGAGLPDAAVYDLEITAPRRFLLAATWGRGAWGASIGPRPTLNDLLHLTGVSNVDARLKYTFHPLLGGWQPFIDVNAQASNNPGILNAVACAADGDDLHVIATTTFAVDPTNGGKLWHTIRFADGSWQGFFDNVKAEQHIDPGFFTDDISCVAAFGLLHVFGCTTGDGDLWHTTRTAATGAWQDFENVDTKVPSGSVPGAFFGVGCAVIDNGDLHVVTITSVGPGTNQPNLYHNILPNTPVPRMWQDFTPVQSLHSVPSNFAGVSCSAAGGDLHFAGVTSDGTLWHSVLPGGARLWHDFENVSTLVTNTPGPFIAEHIGCAVADNGDLYIVATTGDGELWLTSLPAATGSGWGPFVDVKTLVSNYPGPFLAVSIASPVKFIQ